MGKKGIDQENLTDLISTLLKQYPPTNERNTINAFKTLIDDFPEITSYLQWKSFYSRDKKPIEIAENILIAPKIRVSNTFGGWGGKRGLSRKWKIYSSAEDILFNTEAMLKKRKIQIDDHEFRSLMYKYAEKDIPGLDPKVEDALLLYSAILGRVYAKWEETFDIHNSKHVRAVELLLGGNYPLPPSKSKGKQVTQQSISKAVTQFRNYITYNKSKGKKYKDRKNAKFYRDKFFYYLTWLTSLIVIKLGLGRGIRRGQAIKQIQTVLEPFSWSERTKILDGLRNKDPYPFKCLPPPEPVSIGSRGRSSWRSLLTGQNK